MKKLFAAALFCCVLCGAFSQAHGRGAILDTAQYEKLPRKAPQISRAYANLPTSVSLKNYTPLPGNQGQYGTCTAWAAAYAARTIAESAAFNRTDKRLTTNQVFSPAFVYKSISDDPTCRRGTSIPDALNLMKDPGIPKMTSAERTTDFPNIPLAWFINERKYTIVDYATLYPANTDKNAISKTGIVKKSLAEGKPVIAGIICPDSFDYLTDVWYPTESPDLPAGGHAICVIGYDDEKYGGAFEIQNSWGTDWGNEGYAWIPYRVFDDFAYHAYEMIDNLATYGEVARYSGKVQIELRNVPEGMPVIFRDGYYQTLAEYPSGTRFRYLLGNDNPAYVYAFASDEATRTTSMIFPFEGQNVSPVLDYSENFVAFPSENTWIQLDTVPGTDYLIVLYSKEALDIDAIRRRFETTAGSFPQRVAQAVGDTFIPYSRAAYETGEIRFSAQSLNPKAVFGLLLAIKHR
jgi:hypothetical protein